MPYPSPFPEPPHLQGVPTFLRKFYHTDYIDVVPPQKKHKTKKIQQSSQYIACIYPPPLPPSDALEGTEK